MVGPSSLWVKSPLTTAKTNFGKGQGQMIYRYFADEMTFKIGHISYFTFPRHPDPKKHDSVSVIYSNIQKLYPTVNFFQQKISDKITSFTSDIKNQNYFIQVYYLKGDHTYSIVTSMLKKRYLESTMAEANWIQKKLLMRAEWFDKNGSKKRVSFNLPFKLLNQFIKEANAEVVNPHVQNCPPPTAPTGTLPTTCPSPATCSGLSPLARPGCLTRVQACHTTNMNNQVGNLRTDMGALRSDVNCQSALWGRRIDDLKGWGDGKQKWMDEKILPMVDDINGNITRGLNLAEKVTKPTYMQRVQLRQP